METDGTMFLGMKAIYEKLLLSRSSFERLRAGTLLAHFGDKVVPFPQHTLMIGRRPLWSIDSLNSWINSST